MKAFAGYETTEVIVQAEKLPVGGYVLKVLNTELLEYTWGEVLRIDFDIAEGEYKDFFKQQYAANQNEDKKWKGAFRMNVAKGDGTELDGWTAQKFKTNMVAIENSNPGYSWNWDEKTLKDKIVGAVFNDKEYEVNGTKGVFTNCHSFISAEDVRAGKFKIPAVTKLKGSNNTTANQDGFVDVAGGNDEDLPFN